jgi:hypothetical protein
VQLKQPHVRKHVHAWVLKGQRVWIRADTWLYERECSTCACTQVAQLTSADLVGIPDSLHHLCDAEWRTGRL